jgi:two-component system LytT family response regulator
MSSDYNCVIVDDESAAINLLSSRLKKLYNNINIVNSFTKWEEAVNALRAEQCDILFMDMMMPGKNGMALLRLLPNINSEIIFVTAHDEFAVSSFQFAPAGYLIKPVADTDLAVSVNKAMERIQYKRLATQKTPEVGKVKKRIGIPNYRGVDYVSVDDILYFEAVGRYVKVVKKDSEILSSYNVGKFLNIFNDDSFLQVHRSYIINPDCIKRYESIGMIIMTNGKEIPLSKNFKDNFLRSFNKITRLDAIKNT